MRRALIALTLCGIFGWHLTAASIDGQETKSEAGAKPEAKSSENEKNVGDKKDGPKTEPDKKADEKKADEKKADEKKADEPKPNAKREKEKLPAKAADGPKPAAKKPLEHVIITPEREAAAMAFATHHHPELATLLTALSTRNPQQYQNALRDLYRASERLAQTQEKDAERYELDLADWKVGSRIQMLIAKLSMSANQAVQDELRVALGEQADIRIRLLTLERDRAIARQTKAEELLSAAQKGRSEEVERRMDMLLKNAKTKQKAAADKRAEKTAAKGDKSVEKSADKPPEKEGAKSPEKESAKSAETRGSSPAGSN